MSSTEYNLRMWFVRFVILNTQAFGHLLRDTDVILYKLSKRRKYQLPLLFAIRGKLISNKLMLETIRKYVFVLPPKFYLFLRFTERICPQQYLERQRTQEIDEDTQYRCHLTPSIIAPILDEIQVSSAQNVLNKTGFFDSSLPLIALSVRESNDLEDSWSTLRNSSINIYANLVHNLIELGFQVVRIGRSSHRMITNDQEGYFDYSLAKSLHADHIDFFLAKKSSWGISTGTGVDEILNLYRKPMVLVNVFPVSQIMPSPLIRGVLPKRYFFDNKRQFPKTLADFRRVERNIRENQSRSKVVDRDQIEVTEFTLNAILHTDSISNTSWESKFYCG